MTLITHIAATAIGTVTYHAINMLLVNRVEAIKQEYSTFTWYLDFFTQVYQSNKTIPELQNGRKNIQNPKSNLGEKQIHELCFNVFNDKCDYDSECLVRAYCKMPNYIDQTIIQNQLFSSISGVLSFTLTEILMN